MRNLISTILLFSCTLAIAQSTYVPLNADYYHLLDKTEVVSGENAKYHTSQKPYRRDFVSQQVLQNDTLINESIGDYLIDDNNEWGTNKRTKPFNRTLYNNLNGAAYTYQSDDFMIVANPVLNLQYGKSSALDASLFQNTKGVEIRGWVDKKIGFYSILTDNQISFPQYLNNYTQSWGALAGEGFYKPFKTNGYDYISARGYITASPIKHVQLQFGHDKNFIGNGIRSLSLSDNSNAYLFLKAQTTVWKFQYTNLFAQMSTQSQGTNQLYPRKYFAMHHLSLNVLKNLNIGLFESIVFGRKDSLSAGSFDANYLNPIIFYRWAEQNNGSPDNANIGMDIKYNLFKTAQLYGSVFIDEFIFSNVKAGKGAWENKQALQFGAKYFNVFTVKGLDAQVEYNYIRPYTYTHADNYSNYTNYGQALAHPMGANIKELMGIIRYQPNAKLLLKLQGTYYIQGVDTSANTGKYNFGGDIFKSYNNVSAHHLTGNTITQGVKNTTAHIQVSANYMLYHNLFIDAIYGYRKSTAGSLAGNETYFTLGLRLNIATKQTLF